MIGDIGAGTVAFNVAPLSGGGAGGGVGAAGGLLHATTTQAIAAAVTKKTARALRRDVQLINSKEEVFCIGLRESTQESDHLVSESSGYRTL